MKIDVIAFDADDTLWDNEHYFKRNEEAFCELFSEFLPAETVLSVLNETGKANISLYGYGIKSFMLSLIETAINLENKKSSVQLIKEIVALGKKMIDEPVNLISGVENVLKELHPNYKLILATKGDLIDQERKLKKSGLLPYFHHVEIMSNKEEYNYLKLLKHLDIHAEAFLMVGNSLKSDIIPVLNIGGNAVHIPYHITNVHEQIDGPIENPRLKSLSDMNELIAHLSRSSG